MDLSLLALPSLSVFMEKIMLEGPASFPLILTLGSLVLTRLGGKILRSQGLILILLKSGRETPLLSLQGWLSTLRRT